MIPQPPSSRPSSRTAPVPTEVVDLVDDDGEQFEEEDSDFMDPVCVLITVMHLDVFNPLTSYSGL